MLEILSLIACGWLFMHNPTENLKLSITEWEHWASFDTAKECMNLMANAQKVAPDKSQFDVSRHRCVPSDAVYPPAEPKK
jgi:hypothetical protein